MGQHARFVDKGTRCVIEALTKLHIPAQVRASKVEYRIKNEVQRIGDSDEPCWPSDCFDASTGGRAIFDVEPLSKRDYNCP
jgi:hypothetical protein